MQYGPLTDDAAGFRAVCAKLSGHPAYANLRIGAAPDILEMLQRGQTFGAVQDGELHGVILWRTLPTAQALDAIRKKNPELPPSAPAESQEVALVALIAPSPHEAIGFLRRFVRSQAGRIIVFERHHERRPPQLGWFDRSGRAWGQNF